MTDQEWFDSWQGPKSLYQSGSVWSAWIGWNTPLAGFGVTGRQAVATGMDKGLCLRHLRRNAIEHSLCPEELKRP